MLPSNSETISIWSTSVGLQKLIVSLSQLNLQNQMLLLTRRVRLIVTVHWLRSTTWIILDGKWECRESNPGQLVEKHERYLRAMLKANFRVDQIEKKIASRSKNLRQWEKKFSELCEASKKRRRFLSSYLIVCEVSGYFNQSFDN